MTNDMGRISLRINRVLLLHNYDIINLSVLRLILKVENKYCIEYYVTCRL